MSNFANRLQLLAFATEEFEKRFKYNDYFDAFFSLTDSLCVVDAVVVN